MGIRVSDTSRLALSEKVTVSAWSAKSCRATPSTNTMGRNTQMVVSVEAVTAMPTSEAPFMAASKTPRPSSRNRWMDSSTTMELSTSMPMPRARPPRLMMFSDRSNMYMKKKVITTDSGMDSEMIEVLLKSRRNRNRTPTARMPPRRPVSSTSSTAWRMKMDWSNTGVSSRRTPPTLMSGSRSWARCLTASATRMVLASAAL